MISGLLAQQNSANVFTISNMYTKEMQPNYPKMYKMSYLMISRHI